MRKFRAIGGVIATAVSVAMAGILALPSIAATAPTTPPATLLTQGVKIGAYAPPSPYDGGLTGIQDLEATLGRKMEIVNWYKKWGDTTGQFTTTPGGTLDQLRVASQNGRIPTITWEPWTSGDTMSSTFMPAVITAGGSDGYIASWADGLKAFGKTVYLRPMHEMNGTWYPWTAQDGVQTAADYVAAWRHIVDVFRARGASNVKWIWSVNNIDYPASNTMESYWPGDNYVDVMGIDAYNSVNAQGWRTFEELVRPAYNRLTALSATDPIWINEIGSAEPQAGFPGSAAHSKAEWYIDMMNTTGMPRLAAIVMFNEARDANDWTITSSAGSAPAFRNALSQAAGWVAPPAGTTYGSKLPAPTGFVAKRSSTQTELDWNPVAGANGYVILRDGAAVAYTQDTVWIDAGLPSSTTYTYTVAAVRGGTRGSTAPLLSAVPAPVYLSGTASGSRITLTWSATAGETFQVLRDGTVIATKTAAGSTDSFVDSGLPANTSYLYQVRSTAIASKVSDQMSIMSAPAAPAPASAGTYMTKGVLTWPAVPGAVSYQVSQAGTVVATVPASSSGPATYMQDGLTSGVSTVFTVSAVNAAGGVSAPGTASVWTTPGIPDGVTVTAGSSGLTVAWTPVPNATGYAIYRNGDTAVMKLVSGTSFTDPSVVFGQSYSYVVRAISNASGSSLYSPASASATAVASMVATPATLSGVAAGSTVALTWNGVPGADGYLVYREGVLIGDIASTDTSYNDTSAPANTTVTYSVEATMGSYRSAPAYVDVLTAPAAPKLTASPTRYTTKAALTISAVAGADSYQVLRNGSVIATLPASVSTFTDTGLLSATSYRYTVIAVNAAGSKSPVSAQTTVWTNPLAPKTVTASFVRGSGVTLTWPGVNRATSYQVFIASSTASPKYAGQVVLPGTVTYLDRTAAAAASGSTISYWVQSVRDIGTDKLFSAKTLVTVTIP